MSAITDPKAVQLPRTEQRIAAPFPVSSFVKIFQLALEASVGHGSVGGDQVVTSMQARHICDPGAWARSNLHR
jgi:hypothetical protein